MRVTLEIISFGKNAQPWMLIRNTWGALTTQKTGAWAGWCYLYVAGKTGQEAAGLGDTQVTPDSLGQWNVERRRLWVSGVGELPVAGVSDKAPAFVLCG